MRRAIDIFYRCVVGGITILLALSIYGMSQQWHIRMMFAIISQQLTLAQSNPSDDEAKKTKTRDDLREVDIRILEIAQRKPFISFMSADEAAAVKKAKADLGLSQ